MKAVVLSGITRRNGNTMKLTQSFMDGLLKSGCQIDFIDTCKINISPCTGCLNCEKTGHCIIDDDMKYIYSKVEESEIIVLSSPLYFASVTSQLKTVIDRFQCFYSRKYILKIISSKKKNGYLIFTAGGTNEKMIDSVSLTVKYFMLSCNASLNDVIYALGTDISPVEQREELLKLVYNKGFIAGRG